MKQTKFQSIIIITLVFIFSSCSTVPLSGRKQVNLIPSSEMQSMSFQQYDQFIGEHQLSTNQSDVEMVKRVGHKIRKAVEGYLAQNNRSELLDGYKWEINLVQDDQVNAWAMPGGKVVIYTGILPITQDETGLAVVMGHEIAHAIANHGSERMSHQLVQQAGGIGLSLALQEHPAQTQEMWAAVYGYGSHYAVMLPYSRVHESEADHLGLIFMAMAGYNPQIAPIFWKRMSQTGGSKPPEILSTHPSDETRIKDLNKWMPEALKYYNGNSHKGTNANNNTGGKKKKSTTIKI